MLNPKILKLMAISIKAKINIVSVVGIKVAFAADNHLISIVMQVVSIGIKVVSASIAIAELDKLAIAERIAIEVLLLSCNLRPPFIVEVPKGHNYFIQHIVAFGNYLC